MEDANATKAGRMCTSCRPGRARRPGGSLICARHKKLWRTYTYIYLSHSHRRMPLISRNLGSSVNGAEKWWTTGSNACWDVCLGGVYSGYVHCKGAGVVIKVFEYSITVVKGLSFAAENMQHCIGTARKVVEQTIIFIYFHNYIYMKVIKKMHAVVCIRFLVHCWTAVNGITIGL